MVHEPTMVKDSPMIPMPITSIDPTKTTSTTKPRIRGGDVDNTPIETAVEMIAAHQNVAGLAIAEQSLVPKTTHRKTGDPADAQRTETIRNPMVPSGVLNATGSKVVRILVVEIFKKIDNQTSRRSKDAISVVGLQTALVMENMVLGNAAPVVARVGRIAPAQIATVREALVQEPAVLRAEELLIGEAQAKCDRADRAECNRVDHVNTNAATPTASGAAIPEAVIELRRPAPEIGNDITDVFCNREPVVR